ncbi:TlpA disulfide reductase family protein [Nevskia sp.]|uniref:TlpA family protein disulfide reductase n=1 Tax=Nevskia sp. TaxID=1929292 RepID=UPI0025FEF6E0|nr:TlpA disulfide reductase family protein [Nevskia sp.]
MSSARTSLVVAAACLAALAAGVAVFLLRPGAAPEQVGTIPATANEQAPASAMLTDLDGRAFTLADYKGKLVIVNFWATWCAPCLHEIPVLVKMQERYAARGFQLIGPAVDDIEEARRAAPGLKFNYPVAVGSPEAMLDLMTQLGNEQGGLPFSVVIAPDGRVLERQLGEYSEIELAALIEENLPQ